MHGFIDESGIHKDTGLSTVAMFFIMPDAIEELEKVIISVEKSLHIPLFHWTHHTMEIRKKFLDKVLTKNILNKISIEISVRHNPLYYHDFLSASLGMFIRNKKVKHVIFDGQKTHSYERRIKGILRSNKISTRILSIRKDGASPLLRLADALAGLFRFHLENPEHIETKRLFNLIARNASNFNLSWL